MDNTGNQSNYKRGLSYLGKSKLTPASFENDGTRVWNLAPDDTKNDNSL